MSIAGLLMWMETSKLAVAIKSSGYWFPAVESLHVIALTMVFGTVAIVDLRLAGLTSSRRAFTKLAADTLKWTWVAFAFAALTGTLLFITNAQAYYNNLFFRWKMLLLLLAGVNMTVFSATTLKTVERWDTDPVPPLAGRTVGIVSLLLWIGVIFCGRWIGFTT
jgi:hypothetical protein